MTDTNTPAPRMGYTPEQHEAFRKIQLSRASVNDLIDNLLMTEPCDKAYLQATKLFSRIVFTMAGESIAYPVDLDKYDADKKQAELAAKAPVKKRTRKPSVKSVAKPKAKAKDIVNVSSKTVKLINKHIAEKAAKLKKARGK